MATPLRVLILADRLADAELALHELRRAGFEPDWRRVETEQEPRRGARDRIGSNLLEIIRGLA